MTAFHLNIRANCSRLTIDEVSLQYDIPDLLQGTQCLGVVNILVNPGV